MTTPISPIAVRLSPTAAPWVPGKGRIAVAIKPFVPAASPTEEPTVLPVSSPTGPSSSPTSDPRFPSASPPVERSISPDLFSEKASLEAELQQLCKEGGEIDRAWKEYGDWKKNIAGALPKISAQEALTRYEDLFKRKVEVETVLAKIALFFQTFSKQDEAITEAAQEIVRSYKNEWTQEKEKIVGPDNTGTLNQAWIDYVDLRETLSGPDMLDDSMLRWFVDQNLLPANVCQKALVEAYAKYFTLAKRDYLLRAYINAADQYLAAPNVAAIVGPEKDVILSVMAEENDKLKARSDKLGNESVKGTVDLLWNVRYTTRAYENYLGLVARRKIIEARLAELSSSPARGDFSTAASLVMTYDSRWDSNTQSYKDLPFDEAEFTRVAQANIAALATLPYDIVKDYGYLEKRVVNPGTKIFVRADLHGDLKSLLENLKTLQAQGLLDSSFKCRPGVQLVFLGDYADRGLHSMQVLQLLMTLKMDNPGQVTLIRGNHESLFCNIAYCGADQQFRRYMSKESNRDTLNELYQTMPLTLFMGEQTNPVEEVQYTAFTHGAFELYGDPFRLLNSEGRTGTTAVPKAPPGKPVYDLLSERVQRLEMHTEVPYEEMLKAATTKQQRKELKLERAANKICELARAIRQAENADITAYNWGDMKPPVAGDPDPDSSVLGMIGKRTWRLSGLDVKQYFRVISSSMAKVKLLFRGHEHETQHQAYEGKTVVTTLPVGMDSPGYRRKFEGQFDTGYILTTAHKVKDWMKQAMYRVSGSSETEVKEACPIRSIDV